MRRIKGKLIDADRPGALNLLAHNPKGAVRPMLGPAHRANSSNTPDSYAFGFVPPVESEARDREQPLSPDSDNLLSDDPVTTQNFRKVSFLERSSSYECKDATADHPIRFAA